VQDRSREASVARSEVSFGRPAAQEWQTKGKHNRVESAKDSALAGNPYKIRPKEGHLYCSYCSHHLPCTGADANGEGGDTGLFSR
jgi:hypothetical protein